MNLLKIILLIFISITFVAKAHEESHSQDDFNERAYLDLIEAAIQMEVPKAPPPKGTPVLRVSGELIPLDSEFWNLARGWLRIYFNEIKKDCDDCLELSASPDELIANAQDEVAKGFAKTNLLEPIGDAIEHISAESADIGARLGAEALTLKIAAEVAETVGSKAVGGAGIHVLCTVIDAVIIFGMRRIQTSVSILHGSYALTHKSIRPAIKYWLVSRSIARAKKRVGFLAGPIDLDDESLELMQQEGGRPSRLSLQSNSYRVQWLLWLTKKSAQYSTQRQQVLKQLQADPGDRRWQKKLRRIDNKLYQISRVKHNRGFLGKRRSKFYFLRGKGPVETAINGSMMNRGVLWVAALQEDVFERSIHRVVDNPNHELSYDIVRNEDAGPIERGLVKDWGLHKSENSQKQMLSLISEVGEIFNHQLPAKQRYLKVLILESVVAQLMYRMVSYSVDQYDQYPVSWAGRVAQHFLVKWRSGSFARYLYQYSDFLRVMAMSNDPMVLQKYKYEAGEVLIRVFEHMEQLQELLKASSGSRQFNKDIQQLNKKLYSYRPWKEKKLKRSLIGRAPKCQSFWGGDH